MIWGGYRQAICSGSPALLATEPDHLRERLDALEHQVQTLHQQTQTAARQLRWWRGTACGLVVLSLLSLTLLSGNAADAQSGASANRLADLQDKLVALEGILRPEPTCGL
jgi:hypothetical protein